MRHRCLIDFSLRVEYSCSLLLVQNVAIRRQAKPPALLVEQDIYEKAKLEQSVERLTAQFGGV